MAQSMLKSKKMPKEFWAKAVECGVYLSNYFPIPSVWNKTPQQAWNGRKQNISHLRVFESIAYAHVSYQKRSKLDDKSEKYIFICYDSSSKGYRLYNPNKGKIIISRDVKFNKDEAWDWGAQEGDYDILFPYRKKNKQWEAYKRLLLHFLHQLMRFQQYHPYWNALVEGHYVIEVYKIFMRQ